MIIWACLIYLSFFQLAAHSISHYLIFKMFEFLDLDLFIKVHIGKKLIFFEVALLKSFMILSLCGFYHSLKILILLLIICYCFNLLQIDLFELVIFISILDQDLFLCFYLKILLPFFPILGILILEMIYLVLICLFNFTNLLRS
jgi:hypothetical protein